VNSAIDGQRGAHSHFDGAFVENGERAGEPRQTGHTLEFGGSPNRVEQPQKILVLVRSWTWTSKPMTGSYLASSSGDMADSVANFVMAEEKV